MADTVTIASYLPTFDIDEFASSTYASMGIPLSTQNSASVSFTSGGDYFVTSLSVEVNYRYALTGYILGSIIHAGIYAADANGKPTGALLGGGTINLSEEIYGTGSNNVYTGSFSSTNICKIDNGSSYCLVVRQVENAFVDLQGIGKPSGAYTGKNFTSSNNGSTWSATSNDIWFKVEGRVVTPDTVTSYSPSNGATSQPDDITLTWNEADVYTTSFDIYLDADPNPVGTTKVVDDTYQLSYTPPAPLVVSQLYYWRIVPKNVYANGSATDLSFTTGPDTEVNDEATFQAIKDNPTGRYYLTADITITGNFTPIGNFVDGTFTGTIDGRGFTVDFSGATILDANSGYWGPLGVCGACVVDDLHFTGVTVGDLTRDRVGGFVAYSFGTFTNCTTTGATVTADDYGGGFIGYIETGSAATFYNCAAINATVVGDSGNTGGFVGFYASQAGSSVTGCYSSGTVTDNSNSIPVGGFVGWHNATSELTDCYSTCNVTGNGIASMVGGFVGRNDGDISRCYSTGTVTGTTSTLGAFVGFCATGKTINYCYWDKDTSDLKVDGGGNGTKATGKFTVEMKKQATFETWTFGNSVIWKISETLTYPVFTLMPSPATLSYPADTATGVTISPLVLQWSFSTPYPASSYDVYIGTTETFMELVANTSSLQYDVSGIVDESTSYYWTVVAKDVNGSNETDTFSFTTGSFSPPDPTIAGANAMITYRRLVVVCNDELWYEDI